MSYFKRKYVKLWNKSEKLLVYLAWQIAQLKGKFLETPGTLAILMERTIGLWNNEKTNCSVSG